MLFYPTIAAVIISFFSKFKDFYFFYDINEPCQNVHRFSVKPGEALVISNGAQTNTASYLQNCKIHKNSFILQIDMSDILAGL